MHELSLAQSVTEIVCRHAGGRRVTKIELKIGRMRQVVPASLLFSFELVSAGTIAEGAEVVLESIPVICACRQCKAETEQREFPFQCASCGSFDLRVVAGEEFEVEAIECLEESDDVARTPENVGR